VWSLPTSVPPAGDSREPWNPYTGKLPRARTGRRQPAARLNPFGLDDAYGSGRRLRACTSSQVGTHHCWHAHELGVPLLAWV
jgi:hypothetical protein